TSCRQNRILRHTTIWCAQGNGFTASCATLLFNRIESSVVAFRETVTRLIERHKIFLNGLDDGVIIAGEEVEDLLKGIEEGDAENADLRAQLEKLAEKYDPNDFRLTDLRRDVESELHTLQELAKH